MRKRMSGSVLLLVTLAVSLTAGDVLSLTAQDPQTPTPTQTPEKQTKKKSTSKKKRADTTTTTATGDQTAPSTDAMPAPGQQQTEPAQTQPQTTTPAQTKATRMQSEQTDLSGTYAGTFNCDALGLSGDTTLTITGNQFTTAEGKSGRIVASTTGGYTAVALQTGEVATGTAAATAAAATPPTIVSLRARKRGNSLTLAPAPGSTMQCSFAPTRNMAKGRRSRRTPAATGTEVSNPATMPSPTTTPTQPTRPTEQPVPSQTPEPSPSPTPTPSPTPSGTPTPEPSPTPSGTPSPEPAPTATPAPSPTPTPTPSPSPARPRG